MSITPYQTNGAAVAVPDQAPSQVSAVAQLVEWAHGAQAAHEVAVNLVNTSFCPAHYRGKPEEATAAILAGLEVGLQPMASLQAFVPIQGSAAAKAVTLRAIVQSHGHDLWVEETTATRAVVAGRRKGSQQVQRSEWTIQRAQTMGLTDRAQWKAQPTAMLIARATSECARMIASDAILGIPYAVEELEDGGGSAPVQATAEQVASPVAARRRNAASVLPPQAEPAPEPVAEQQGPIDPKGVHRARLIELIRSTGIDREAFLKLAGWAAGRPVGSEKELTADEASAVIARLEQLPAADETKESDE